MKNFVRTLTVTSTRPGFISRSSLRNPCHLQYAANESVESPGLFLLPWDDSIQETPAKRIATTYHQTGSPTLPPIIIPSRKWVPPKICFLSFRVIFHFHDYGRKGICPLFQQVHITNNKNGSKSQAPQSHTPPKTNISPQQKWLEWWNCLFEKWSLFLVTRDTFPVKVTQVTLPKTNWKWMVGIVLSYWGGLFSGAMLVSGRVLFWGKGWRFKWYESGGPLSNIPARRQPETSWIECSPHVVLSDARCLWCRIYPFDLLIFFTPLKTTS